MAYKHTQDIPGGYMDNVRVKISEKYKPPPRIVLAMSYSQRLTLNKHIQDTIPDYEFVLEKTVIEKMKEWRTARSVMFQELNDNVQKARDESLNKLKEKQLEFANHYQEEEIELDSTIAAIPTQSVNHPIYSVSSQPMLIPTQANSYSNILTPIPLKEQSFNQNYQPVDKSPFNISDFEADTSSPFDNMELKSINDMEELAQVLKLDQPPSTTNIPTNFTMMGASNFYSIPSSVSYAHQPVTSSPHYTNGFYYVPETIQSKTSFNSIYSTYNANNHIMENNKHSIPNKDLNKPTSFKSVPHIIKSLETELVNTQIDNTRQNKEADDRFVKAKHDDLYDEFSSLPKNIQDLSKAISLMGFPLSRVARVCKVIGNDQKKVVDHLLAMSELLDLGFPESKVSTALFQCDNDRDKALDILIS